MPPSKSRRRFSSASVSWDGLYQEGPVHRGRRRRRNTSSAVAYAHSSAGEHAVQSSDDHESSDDSFLDSPSTIPLIYASLPPTPITPSESPTSPTFPETASPAFSPPFSDTPFSLWDYLREELLATDFDSHQELKWERVSNFLSMPLAMEKACVLRFHIATCFHASVPRTQIIGFGFILCFDSFLYTFTILPIRFFPAFLRFVVQSLSFSPPPIPASQKADILRMALLASSVLILIPLTDASKIYHSIRGQDTIKLYVIFNALEVSVSYISCHSFCLQSDCRPIMCEHRSGYT
jgi:hypothetical protein